MLRMPACGAAQFALPAVMEHLGACGRCFGLAGTPGYICPSYASTGRLSEGLPICTRLPGFFFLAFFSLCIDAIPLVVVEGSEVYSFGMVLLEARRSEHEESFRVDVDSWGSVLEQFASMQMLLNVMPAVVTPDGLHFPLQELIHPEDAYTS
eukprot:6020243-Amphidinium_carterae.1